MESLEEYQKYVAVVFDEMKIKGGIVYNKHECKIVGFVNLGAINSTLIPYTTKISPRENFRQFHQCMSMAKFFSLNIFSHCEF